ncbi:MAG: MFS transporter [Pseudomonadota bacterium]
MTESSDWRAILSAFLVGVSGAVQVGRIAPVAPLLEQDLQLDLLTLGWLISLVTLASAVLGLLAGYAVVRAGLRISVIAGALLMGLCAAVSALAPSVPMLIGTRIVEGFGYLIVVVAAPTLIAQAASRRDAPLALAIWGTFFTLGLSIGAVAGGAIGETVGWRGWFLASAALMVLAAAAVLIWTSAQAARADARLDLAAVMAEMPKAAWLLGAAFLGLTLLSLAVLSLLPTFLVQEHGFSPSRAGSVTGGVALASIAGSLSYGMLARRLPEPAIAAAASAALIAAAFPTFAAAAAPGQTLPCAALVVFMSGILVAQTFAAVPRIAGAPRLIGPVNGLVAQFGSIGALSGPPLVGALISVADWRAVPLVAASFALSFLGLFVLAVRFHAASILRDPT